MKERIAYNGQDYITRNRSGQPDGYLLLPTHRRRQAAFTPTIDNVYVRGFRVNAAEIGDYGLQISGHRPLVCSLLPDERTAPCAVPSGQDGTNPDKPVPEAPSPRGTVIKTPVATPQLRQQIAISVGGDLRASGVYR